MQRSLTTENLACRQTLPKELPTFSGRPEEWAIFYSNFNYTTELCGYTEAENMVRLQRALKGVALKAVSSLLLFPSMVPEVIRTLKMLYGRPELVIRTLIEKVKNEPAPKAEKFETLVGFALSVKELYSTMEAGGLKEYIKNPALLQELVDKLPPHMRLNWAVHASSLQEKSLKEFSVWMNIMAEAATTLITPGADLKPGRKTGHVNSHIEQRIEKTVKRTCCFACNGEHKLTDCNIFKDFSVSRKWEIVKRNDICELCLKHFKRSKCFSKKICGVDGCSASHHPALHADRKRSEVSKGLNCNTAKSEDFENVLFKIVPVTIYGKDRSVNTYAFLDSGSSLTLVEQGLMDSLNIRGESSPLCLRWTADIARWEKDSEVVSMEISAVNEEKRYRLIDVHTVDHLGLPRQTFDANVAQQKYYHLQGLPLTSLYQAQPRLLIGLKNENLIVSLEHREGGCNEPVAIRTRLGWVACGGVGLPSGGARTVGHHIEVCECDHRLHQEVRDFFTLENQGAGRAYLETAEERRAKQILRLMTKRVGQRFESGLLWKFDQVSLPDSYSMALSRLQCLERKIKLEKELLSILNDQIENLVVKGYARKLTLEEQRKMHLRTWYLPTFIVRNVNKPNKLRLVWDAAAKVEGISLNTMLMKGPDQLTSLPEVLFAFRSHRIAICGDIAEMFHQVRVREEDRHAQRFLWRNGDSRSVPDIYEMEVLTFGASCSPSIAQFVKNMNAEEFVEKYPRAVTSIKEHHYVDDMMDSADTVEEAVQLAKDVRHIHAQGGFVIRNWLSNSEKVIKELGQVSSIEEKAITVPEEEISVAKVLGIWWKTEPDVFTFSLRLAKLQEEILTGTRTPTKRELLRLLMTIFDPLGFIAHHMIKLKILLQEVWRLSVDWDETIPENLQQQWNDWLKILPRVQDIEIPRSYSAWKITAESSIQLHIFVDASEQAMATAAYFRICNGSRVTVNIIMAKTKVAPRLPWSIPRMELHAALMGARLAEFITKSHKIKIDRRVIWSDSRTVLSWLGSDARRYNQFVMYRISEILEKTELNEWRWVSSKNNVADDATKWNQTSALSRDERWFKGASFLYQPEEKWPEKINRDPGEQQAELRPKYVLAHRVYLEPVMDFKRFSSWKRLLRSTAWVLRFLKNCRYQRAVSRSTGVLSGTELQQAEYLLVRTAQQQIFSDEIAILKAKKSLKKSSALFGCSPYLDHEEILRMKGRIDRATCVDECMKKPILLPRDHRITDLLLAYWHERYHHCCHGTVLNEIRQRYWVPRLRSKLKAVRQRCKVCYIKNAQPDIPEMAALPAARLAAYERPFTYVGVDYFGPMSVTVGRRSEKRWGVLFTCMTIRAVHLEMAYSLSTDSCIVCIRNFMARRGTPREFFSDNGTNFKGTESELKEAFNLLDKMALEEKINSPETTWKWNFNPPAAPHMGGSWERLIGSVKTVLKEVTRNQRLQDESLHSFLLEAEAIVNSRPLTYVQLEDYDEDVLTPNHFLLGSSSGSKPPGLFYDKDLVLRKNWRKCQKLAETFWKRWVDEYLPTLTRRSKWFRSSRPLKEGDLVIIVDKNLPRCMWPKGIVIAVNRAADGQVRSAAVRTSVGVLTRPATKLAVLDIKKSEESETAAGQQHHEGENVENKSAELNLQPFEYVSC